MGEERDVFLCHTSEDKKAILHPLIVALESANITYWYDEAEIKWGDSITEKVNAGLRQSRFVVVILSQPFLEKHWPRRELNAMLNLEAKDGNVRVLPLLVGSSAQRKAVLNAYPLLNDKSYQAWDSDVRPIIDALISRLGRGQEGGARTSSQQSDAKPKVVIPKIKIAFTDKDRGKYLKDAFRTIKEYFETAAKDLESTYPGIEAEVEDIHKLKFVCTIYRDGKIVNKCKIWLGGLVSSNSIAYLSGRNLDVNSDNQMHDWLDIDYSGPELGLRASGMGFGSSGKQDPESILSEQKAAVYFWLRATEPLTRG